MLPGTLLSLLSLCLVIARPLGRRNPQNNEIIPPLYSGEGSSIPTWSRSGLHANLIGTRNDINK